MPAAVHIAEPASDPQLTLLLGYGDFVRNETARFLSNSNAQSIVMLNTGGLSFHLNYRSAR